jgi:4-alpha-glucanotransferase
MDYFGEESGKALEFMNRNEDGTYSFKKEFDTRENWLTSLRKNHMVH